MISLDDLLAKHAGSFQFLCKACFKGSPQEISALSPGAICSSGSRHKWKDDNIALVHVQKRNNFVTYTLIRPIPGAIRRYTGPFHICYHRKYCTKGDGCNFAHSIIEKDAWTCERDGKIARNLFVEQGEQGNSKGRSGDTLKEKHTKRDASDRVVYHQQVQHEKTSKVSWAPSYQGSSAAGKPQFNTRKRTVKAKRLYCELCDKTCNSDFQWHQHCAAKRHATKLSSESKRTWNYRLPPFVGSAEEFRMCREHVYHGDDTDDTSTCTKAHSTAELEEWKERFNSRQAIRNKTRDRSMCSYMDEFLKIHAHHLSQLSSDENGEYVLCDKSNIIYDDNKEASHMWNYSITEEYKLKFVFLLHDEHRQHFDLSSGSQSRLQIIDNSQLVYVQGHCNVTVNFYGGLHGSFSQRVVFQSRDQHIVIKSISVELGDGDVIQKICSRRMELDVKRWTTENTMIIKFSPQQKIDNFTENLLTLYPAPVDTQLVSQQSLQYHLNKDNYVQKMHSVINLEELHIQSVVAKCNMISDIDISQTIMDVPGIVINARQSQLFAKISLREDFWDDNEEASVIQTKCCGILLASRRSVTKVYEAPFLRQDWYGIDGIGKNCLYVCLSEECIHDMNLEAGSTMEGQVQFVMDRSSFCRLHYGIDELKETSNIPLLFPHPLNFKRPKEKYVVKSTFLNNKQMDVVRYAFLQHNHRTPPIVVYGPFGTGKTETLARTAAKITMIKQDRVCRVLICTHTNSAADLYIKNHFHQINEELGDDTLSILRICWKDRILDRVDPVVKQYCKLSTDRKSFVYPSVDEILNSAIVITTLSTSLLLSEWDLQGSFSHIFIDEAGQALEAEAITPFILATPQTCIILAGDHIQTKNTMFSQDIQEEYHQSLLERLMSRYQYHNMNENKVLLNENYRSHPRILRFISRIFYGGDDSLIPKSNEPDVPNVPPLAFYAVRGREERDSHSTSYRNVQEAMEIGEQVKRLYDDWPAEWGEKRMDAIAVVAYFPAQVMLIRFVLRRKKLGKVTVENVLNIPGKEFQCLFISTVRTKHLMEKTSSTQQRQLGFFSDPGILNTALTRARGLVAVVGDPVALYSVGKCRSIWREYLKECIDSGSVFPSGTNLSDIEYQATIEMKQSNHQMESPIHKEYGFGVDVDADQILFALAKQSQDEGWIETDMKTNIGNENDNLKENGIQCCLKEKNGFTLANHLQFFFDEKKRHLISDKNIDEEFENGSEISEEEITNDDILSLVKNDPNRYIKCILSIHSAEQIVAIPSGESSFTKLIQISDRHNCGTAFDGDEVVVEIFSTDNRFGKVVKTIKHSIERRKKLFICYPHESSSGLLVPMDKRFPMFQCLSPQNGKQTLHNQLFVVRYLKWKDGFPFPLGLVVDVLEPGCNEPTGMHILKLEYGLYEEMKSDVNCYLPSLTNSNREMVKDLTFSIDPEGSKILDDAFSFADLENGNCRIGIHIADVSFAIEKDSELDKLAFDRATTADSMRMLPEKLSSDLSLKEGVNRSAVSIFLECDNNNNIQHIPRLPKRTIICSKHQLTYRKVGNIITSMGTNAVDELSNALNRLYKISSVLREKRLGSDASAIQSDECELNQHKSYSLVEEFMIFTNQIIAGILKDHSICAPLRSQPLPDIDELNKWKERHGNDALNTIGLNRYFHPLVNSDEILQEICRCEGKCSCIIPVDELDNIFYTKNDWLKQIKNAVKMDDFEEIKYLVLKDQHPKTLLAKTNLHKIMKHAEYIPSTESILPGHFDLNLKFYTNFTSPIRRFIDIVIHRLLVAIIEESEIPYTNDEIEAICNRCTERMEKVKQFEEEVCKLRTSITLKSCPSVVFPVIEDLNDQQLTLRVHTLDGSFSKSENIPLHLLGLSKEPCYEERKNVLTLEWKMRIYDTSPESRNRRNPKEIHSLQKVNGNRSIEITQKTWQDLLVAVKNEDLATFKENFTAAMQEVDEHIQEIDNNFKRDIICEVKEGSEMKNLYCNFNIELSLCSVVEAQLGSMVTRGLLTPYIQLFNVTPGIGICLEHRSRPGECFGAAATENFSKQGNRNLQEYTNRWQKLLNMEAVHQIVDCNNACLVHHVPVSVPQYGNVGLIHLDNDFCKSRRIEIGCKECKRKDIKEAIVEERNNFSPDDKNERYHDFFCIRFSVKDKNLENETAPQWLAHAVSIMKSKKEILIHFTSFREKPPPEELKGKKVECTVEWIPKHMPVLRMQEALYSLHDASDLAQRIALGTQRRVSSTSETLVIQPDSAIVPGFSTPNDHQTKAVLRALTEPFTLIQGPPGTGKTVTGVRLACLFVNKNKQEYPNRHHQVMYCGPSNKSVDVVARKLRGKDKVSVVRVYGSYTELQRYPIPSNVEPELRLNTDVDLDTGFEDIALHELIRKRRTAGSKQIRALYEHIVSLGRKIDSDSVDEKENIKMKIEETLKKYKKAVTEESVKELCSADVIVCTCVTSCRALFIKECAKERNFNVKQIIIDECGMSMEPESMIPIASFPTAEHITLIGDHKQLQPVVTNPDAKKLGLQISLFQRYADSRHNILLKKQYRMHSEISQFPSVQFYGGQLELGNPVRQKKDSRLGIWPGGRAHPLVFCHVEGGEKTLAVTSQKGNKHSKSNPQEVKEAVRIAARLLRLTKPKQIVILSQYRAQCDEIARHLEGKGIRGVTVSTVVKSQGSEWDYVILSCVRSLPLIEIPRVDSMPQSWRRRHLGFITDPHQINVAITRAKLGLIIIGNKHLLRIDDMWNKLLNHYEKRRAVVDSDKFMNETKL